MGTGPEMLIREKEWQVLTHWEVVCQGKLSVEDGIEEVTIKCIMVSQQCPGTVCGSNIPSRQQSTRY